MEASLEFKNNDFYRAILVHNIFKASSKLKLTPNYQQSTIIILHNYLDIVIKHVNCIKENIIVLMSSLLLLNCKLTENLRTIRDICSVIIMLFNNDYNINQINEDYIKIKMQVIEKEKFILKVLNFNINFDVPFDNLFIICSNMKLEDIIMKMALSILNDCMLSKKSIHISYNVLAIGCIYISKTIISKIENIITNFNNEKWWLKYYNIHDDELIKTIIWITSIQKHFKTFFCENEKVTIEKNIEFIYENIHEI